MPFQSAYRHVYGEVPKKEHWFNDVNKPYTSGEGRYCAANPLYWGVSKAGGGGPVYVCRHDNPGRKKEGDNMITVNVQKGKALDFDFHPFINSLIGIASEDCSVAVAEIPDMKAAGFDYKSVTKAAVMLKGHMKKAHLMKWHPTANNVIASGSWDKTVKLWNVETAECVQTYENAKDPGFSMEWSKDGGLLAMTDKGKQLRIFDPRVPSSDVHNWEVMAGKKASKVFWVPTYNWIGATGFNQQAKRMLRIWDLKATDKPIFEWVIDQQSSVLMPMYDEDTHMLFLAGKGDGSVFFNELVDGKKKVQALGVYRDTTPQKGGAFVPKRSLDVWKCEVARYLKVTRNGVIPVTFRVPRKSGAEIFQDDIYPDTKAGVPSLSADEYFDGNNKDPVLTSMNPEKRTEDGGAVAFVKKKTYNELSTENEELKARIAELEKQLTEISGGD